MNHINRLYLCYRVQPGDVQVQLGASNINGKLNTGVTVPAIRFIMHENFEEVSYKNDIALIELKRPITFNTHMRPICLPTKGKLNFVVFEGTEFSQT